jgi:hypothetical protein
MKPDFLKTLGSVGTLPFFDLFSVSGYVTEIDSFCIRLQTMFIRKHFELKPLLHKHSSHRPHAQISL